MNKNQNSMKWIRNKGHITKKPCKIFGSEEYVESAM